MDSKPVPPAEAALIRVAREAAGLTITEAARRVSAANPDASISTARWSQIEQGYEMRGGQIREVTAKPGMLARMAAVFRIPPERLAGEGGRPDAANILAEIQRQEAPAEPVAEVPEQDESQGPAEDVRIPPDVAIQMNEVALRSIAPGILAHVQDALARNPAAAGADLFPGEPAVARVWDIMSSAEPPFSLSYRVVYAATARLQNMQEEWRSRRSG